MIEEKGGPAPQLHYFRLSQIVKIAWGAPHLADVARCGISLEEQICPTGLSIASVMILFRGRVPLLAKAARSGAPKIETFISPR